MHVQRILKLLLVAIVAANCRTTSRADLAGEGFYQDVSWSPDSKWLAYSRLRGGEWAVFVARRSGRDERRLSSLGTNATWTAWSPDGQEVLYATGSKGHTDIARVSVRHPGTTTAVTSDGASNSAPSWSPDGKRIVFASSRTGKSHLYTVAADGSATQMLTTGDWNNWGPTWSPDGKRILFYSDRHGKHDAVYTIEVDSGTERVVTPPDVHAIYPGWTPRGDIIFCAANEGQPKEIMVVRSDGRILPLRMRGFFARIAPNGKYIAVIEGKYPNSHVSVRPYVDPTN